MSARHEPMHKGETLSGMQTSYDVIVLGSGISGLATALAAREKGLEVVVLEKDNKLGGGTTESAGLIWVGDNHLERAAGYADSRKDVLAYLRFLSGGETCEQNFTAFVDHADAAVSFFERCGIKFQLTRGLPDHYFGTAPGAHREGRSFEVELISGDELGDWRHKVRVPPNPAVRVTAEEMIGWGGVNNAAHWDSELLRERCARDLRGQGVGLICHFLKALLARGVPIHAGQRVERLCVEGEHVTGVDVSGERIVARRGVVLATGGYESNPALVRDLEGWPAWVSQFPPTICGDGYVLATEIGAAVRRLANNMQVILGFPIPVAPGAEPRMQIAGIVELFSPHTMVVNQAGRRFADESYFQGMIPALRQFDPTTHAHANVPCFLIFDQQFARRYGFAGRPSGREIPDWVARADTPAALAGTLGIDAAGLEATCRRFNGFVAAGADTDFHRGEHAWRLAQDPAARGTNQSLGTIEQPPFYGIELRPAGGCSTGILTNEFSQVMHQRRRPIPGLYGVGNVTARVEYGSGYQAGLTLASGMTFGYLAAGHMSGVN
jgi:3-oxosteroid 1-dehydrogenase